MSETQPRDPHTHPQLGDVLVSPDPYDVPQCWRPRRSVHGVAVRSVEGKPDVVLAVTYRAPGLRVARTVSGAEWQAIVKGWDVLEAGE